MTKAEQIAEAIMSNMTDKECSICGDLLDVEEAEIGVCFICAEEMDETDD